MLRHTIFGPLDWVHPDDDAIDFKAWSQEDQVAYFVSSFKLPPMLPGKTPVIYKIEQLSGPCLKEAMRVQAVGSAYNTLSPAWFEWVVRCGLKKVKGLEIYDRKTKESKRFRLQFEKTDKFGEIIQEASFDELLPFTLTRLPAIALTIYTLSHS